MKASFKFKHLKYTGENTDIYTLRRLVDHMIVQI
jgi:hypothetical protein